MTEFTPLAALLGGAILGLAALLLLWLNGNIAGISGIVSRVLEGQQADNLWRWCFIAGLVIGPLLVNKANFSLPERIEVSWPVIIIAGLLVGLGSRLGSGCTSGHGICGIGRFSPRSIVATLVFMLVALLTVFVTRQLMGVSV